MQRPIAYDITHLEHRLSYSAPSGIDKVDLAFAQHFSLNLKKLCAAVHYGFMDPIIFDPVRVTRVVNRVRSRWLEDASITEDLKYHELSRWLLNEVKQPPRENRQETAFRRIAANGRSLLRTAAFLLLRDHSRKIPEGAIYLNVAQHAFELSFHFRWLSKRRDLRPVFFIHDLLPLDFPEFWPAGHEERFERRVACAAEYGAAFITASQSVRDRLHAELVKRGRRDVPIFTHPLPPPNDISRDTAAADAELGKASYFLVVGTLEPRKNHLLLLSIWRELIASGGNVPKLVFVGKRGWSDEQIIATIEHPTKLASHVGEVSGLASSSLRELLIHAKAVLMPSLGEGFGLPVIEALSVGTPVVASDIPVFREIAGDCAIFHHPLDGMAWLRTIRELAEDGSLLTQKARAAAASFRPTSNQVYFDRVEEFLGSLP